MGKGLGASFLSGVLVGTDRGLQRNREQERQDKIDAREQERYDAEKRDRDQRYADSIALRNAASPVEVSNGATVTGISSAPTTYDNADVASSDVRQARMLNTGGSPMQEGQDPSQFSLSSPVSSTLASVVNGKAYSNPGDATAAAASLNTPEAMAGRVATALQKQGKPAEALQFQQQAQKYADTQWDRELRDAMTKGHQGLADFMTRSQGGVFAGKKVAAVPSPDGKTVTYNVVNEDGSMTPTPYTLPNDQNGVITAAYQLSKIDPETRYRHMVEQDKLTHRQDAKDRELTLRERELTEFKGPLAEARLSAAQATKDAADAKAASADKKAQDKTDSEDRKRWTTLLDESGRRLTDSNKALRALQRDPVFMARANKQGSAESVELQGLRDDVKRYDQDRSTYQELLSRGGGGGNNSAPTERTVPPATQAARDADRVPILQAELVKAQQAAASSDPAAAERGRQDVASLQKELQRVGKGTPASKAGASGAPGSSRANPVAVSDRAGRDKLPKGAYYKAPNGEVYIKQ
jgi:hypothetical protein